MAITGRNPCKFRGSMDDGEMVEFYVVQGQRGTEAANVTAPAGAPLKGSCYTAHLTRIRQDFSIHSHELPLRRPKSTEGDADESEGSGDGFTVPQGLRRPLPGHFQDQRLRCFPPSREACDPPPIDPGYHSSPSSNQKPASAPTARQEGHPRCGRVHRSAPDISQELEAEHSESGQEASNNPPQRRPPCYGSCCAKTPRRRQQQLPGAQGQNYERGEGKIKKSSTETPASVSVAKKNDAP
ncbi:Y-box-binding protein 3-like [Oryx dammah]|uniref:Y-box-binding protein 3-like n=1 Tax=Oryx dammah TaxID=59534 RepID=UPI001A9BCF70|nr:Y-box-binding protein 3-like [Oryx dammah]